MITYKVCRECKKVFSNKRKDGKYLGIGQTNIRNFCGRECSAKLKRKYSTVYYESGYCFLLINNRKFKFSQRHLENVIKYSWYEGVLGYAESRIDGKIVRLHTLVFGKDKILKVDHINRDKTDNRDENLRFVTHTENLENSKLNDRPMRGIEIANGKYKVVLTKKGIRYRSKPFIHKEEAIAFRDKLLYDLERRDKQ